jgi:hypothetical protein
LSAHTGMRSAEHDSRDPADPSELLRERRDRFALFR